MLCVFDMMSYKWYYNHAGGDWFSGGGFRRFRKEGFRMKYLKSEWFDGSVESRCEVVTENAYGFACSNGCRGSSSRLWVDFFPKSKVKVIRDDEMKKTRILVPYWLFKSKGIYPNNLCYIGFENGLVEV